MPSVRRLVCLANSWKMQERCIAGIDLATGQWLRPVCDLYYPHDGSIPASVRQIQGQEPRLLDVLAIRLADSGSDFGFEPENRSVLTGAWRVEGRYRPWQVLPYCQSPPLLHNRRKYVMVSELQAKPWAARQTLQLVRASQVQIQPRPDQEGPGRWRISFQVEGEVWRDLKLTDADLMQRLEAGYSPGTECVLTLSLSLPWSPPQWSEEPPCWKLVAGVVELQARDLLYEQTERELRRLGWSVAQGRCYLQACFGKRSRQHLTIAEFQALATALQALTSGDDGQMLGNPNSG